jgi:hypothetical protein
MCLIRELTKDGTHTVYSVSKVDWYVEQPGILHEENIISMKKRLHICSTGVRKPLRKENGRKIANST